MQYTTSTNSIAYRGRRAARVAAAALAAAMVATIAWSPASSGCTAGTGNAEGASPRHEYRYLQLDDDAELVGPTGTMSPRWPTRHPDGIDHFVVTRSGVHGPAGASITDPDAATFTGTYTGRIDAIQLHLWTAEPGQPGNDHLWASLEIDGHSLHRGDAAAVWNEGHVGCHTAPGHYVLRLTGIGEALADAGVVNTTTTDHHVTIAFAPATSRGGSPVEVFGVDTNQTPSSVVFETT